MSDCQKCGQCCRYFELPIEGNLSQDVVEWLRLHGCITLSNLKIIVPLACSAYNRKTKLCTIYNQRPEVCKRFTCNKMKK